MNKTWIYWLSSFVLTAICAYINYHCFRIDNMIALEFSDSACTMKHHIMAIADSGHGKYFILQMNTLIDFGFLVSYSLLTFFSFKLVLQVFQVATKPWVYFLSFITGLLDIIENIFLLKTGSSQREYYSDLFWWVVRIKWAFAIVAILLILIVIIYGAVILFRHRPADANQEVTFN